MSILYPPVPANIPKDITKLPASYKFKAFLAILGILFFFISYAAMVAGMTYLVYWAFSYDMMSVNRVTILLKIGAIAGSVMLLVFTLKFILKLKNHKAENRIKLKKNEQTDLWMFVDKICAQTGAPKPKNIYLDPDVNAYVQYSNVWLSLFLPVRKELTIGMGLVSCLNLSEFRAVVAHEFGHFAQRSMKIGSYIISANTIIHDMIYTRDRFDNILDQWRASDLRLAFPAWIITPVIWIIRQTLALFYQFLNLMYGLLSREMEFNADKVAVSTSGSDAIVSALWKLEPGNATWNGTLNHAYLLAQKNKFVENLYHHNTLALDRESLKIKDDFEGLETHELGGKKYFSHSENSHVSMYASHPPNDLRQANAKSPYINCEEDHRSPWIIFNNTEELQKEMTGIIYKLYLGKESLANTEIAEFEQFIVDEQEGSSLLEEFDNAFANRYFIIPTEKNLEEKQTNFGKDIESEYQKLKTELNKLMKPVQEIEEKMNTVQLIAQGASKTKFIEIDGEKFKKRNLQKGWQILNEKREKIFTEDFLDWDTNFCSLHYHLAKKQKTEIELLNIYKQHQTIVEVYKTFSGIRNTLHENLQRLQVRNDLTELDIRNFTNKVNEWVKTLNSELNKLDNLEFVPMPNIEDVDVLKNTIVENGEIPTGGGKMFENGEFDKISAKLEGALQHLQRIDQKSMGLILSTHQTLITAE